MLKLQAYDPKLCSLVDGGHELIEIVNGGEFFEGPIWSRKKQTLVFSDIPGNTLYSWNETEGQVVIKKDTNRGNGNAFDNSGRIITCEHYTRRVARMRMDGSEYETLATNYEGHCLNSPNDVIVHSNGFVYFTDPVFGIRPTGTGICRHAELPYQGVFMVNPISKDIRLATDEVDNPNGLALSPDERTMYIADTANFRLLAMDVELDGTLSHMRVHAPMIRVDDPDKGVIDGVKVDVDGNIWCTAPGGVQVFDKFGTALGVIYMPHRSGNLCFGGADMQTLFVCSGGTIQTLRTNVKGLPTVY